MSNIVMPWVIVAREKDGTEWFALPSDRGSKFDLHLTDVPHPIMWFERKKDARRAVKSIPKGFDHGYKLKIDQITVETHLIDVDAPHMSWMQ